MTDYWFVKADAPVTILVERTVDGQALNYERRCTEDELDGVIAEEQNKPGRLTRLDISPVGA